MEFKDLHIYKEAMALGDYVWNMVSSWNRLAQNTVGEQLIRSIDSVAANISEGSGRYHFKDRKRFYYYARGSLYESITWVNKASKRGLISRGEFEQFDKRTSRLAVALNRYIASTKNR